MAAKRKGSAVHSFSVKFAGQAYKCSVYGKRPIRRTKTGGRVGKPRFYAVCKRK